MRALTERLILLGVLCASGTAYAVGVGLSVGQAVAVLVVPMGMGLWVGVVLAKWDESRAEAQADLAEAMEAAGAMTRLTSATLAERDRLRAVADAASAYLEAQVDPTTGDPDAEDQRDQLVAALTALEGS